MCAQVLKFRTSKTNSDTASETTDQSVVESDLSREERDDTSAMQFWLGASGTRYIHTVYSLLFCPEVPAINYLLVRRDELGEQKVLAAGRTTHDAQSLNLAEIRRHGATLGANEVHVHRLADSPQAAKLIEHDLRQAQLAETLPPSSTTEH